MFWKGWAIRTKRPKKGCTETINVVPADSEIPCRVSYPGQIMLNVSVQMGNGVSNMVTPQLLCLYTCCDQTRIF